MREAYLENRRLWQELALPVTSIVTNIPPFSNASRFTRDADESVD
jgi:hypothetical protein